MKLAISVLSIGIAQAAPIISQKLISPSKEEDACGACKVIVTDAFAAFRADAVGMTDEAKKLAMFKKDVNATFLRECQEHPALGEGNCNGCEQCVSSIEAWQMEIYLHEDGAAEHMCKVLSSGAVCSKPDSSTKGASKSLKLMKSAQGMAMPWAHATGSGTSTCAFDAGK